uniref:Large ribosomal subunit protein bL33c n=1 Tax=Nitella hyalina TaxID=181804 RepID=A0A2H4G6Y9_NITHY|nr:ribosomal protein L33 [Nitella hyalina]APP89444.1 ribosomal protein L33 [Nitella hyalina]WKT08483.1 ribosomal protein L33 [Nitella hyalina]
MAKSKDTRITIILECNICSNNKEKKIKSSRYTTQKNRRNTPNRLILKKFCSNCKKHNIYNEIKK